MHSSLYTHPSPWNWNETDDWVVYFFQKKIQENRGTHDIKWYLVVSGIKKKMAWNLYSRHLKNSRCISLLLIKIRYIPLLCGPMIDTTAYESPPLDNLFHKIFKPQNIRSANAFYQMSTASFTALTWRKKEDNITFMLSKQWTSSLSFPGSRSQRPSII